MLKIKCKLGKQNASVTFSVALRMQSCLMPWSDTWQRSKLTFWKRRLLATFNYKIFATKKHSGRLLSRARHFVYVTWISTMPSDTFAAALFFAELLRLLAYQLKDCNNGQYKEKEETAMTDSRNCLLQSCWDRVTNDLPYVSRAKVCDPALLQKLNTSTQRGNLIPNAD